MCVCTAEKQINYFSCIVLGKAQSGWKDVCNQENQVQTFQTWSLDEGTFYFHFLILESHLKRFNSNRDNLFKFFQQVLREVKALASLQHGNIVGYNAAWLEYATNFGAECGMLNTCTCNVLTCILQTFVATN